MHVWSHCKADYLEKLFCLTCVVELVKLVLSVACSKVAPAVDNLSSIKESF